MKDLEITYGFCMAGPGCDAGRLYSYVPDRRQKLMPGYEAQALMSNRLERVFLFSPLFFAIICLWVCGRLSCDIKTSTYDCGTVFSFAKSVHRSPLCYQHHHYCHSVNFRRRDLYEYVRR